MDFYLTTSASTLLRFQITWLLKVLPTQMWKTLFQGSCNFFILVQLMGLFEAIDANKDTLITQEEVRNAPLEEYEQDLMEILPQDEEGDEGEGDADDEDDVTPGDNVEYENLGRRGDL